ncbi:hypothetical protein [Candidatus Nitrospira bockiana]
MKNQRHPTLADHLAKVLAAGPLPLEAVVAGCGDATWNQVFMEVDRLTRSNRVRLTRSGISYLVALNESCHRRAESCDGMNAAEMAPACEIATRTESGC